jgi:hypothetical protein
MVDANAFIVNGGTKAPVKRVLPANYTKWMTLLMRKKYHVYSISNFPTPNGYKLEEKLMEMSLWGSQVIFNMISHSC